MKKSLIAIVLTVALLSACTSFERKDTSSKNLPEQSVDEISQNIEEKQALEEEQDQSEELSDALTLEKIYDMVYGVYGTTGMSDNFTEASESDTKAYYCYSDPNVLWMTVLEPGFNNNKIPEEVRSLEEPVEITGIFCDQKEKASKYSSYRYRIYISNPYNSNGEFLEPYYIELYHVDFDKYPDFENALREMFKPKANEPYYPVNDNKAILLTVRIVPKEYFSLSEKSTYSKNDVVTELVSWTYVECKWEQHPAEDPYMNIPIYE